MPEEQIPVHEEIKVIESKTLFKRGKWWKAVSLQKAFGNREIAIYLWKREEDSWKRKQKATIKSKQSWEAMKSAVEELISDL